MNTLHARPHLQTHNRAQGHSAVKGAAYRLGLRLYDRRADVWADYTRRKIGEEIVLARTIAPEGAPSWAGVAAQKSLYRPENLAFLNTLRAIRKGAGLTQGQLAEKLDRSQNFVTAAERGLIRLDGLQLRDWCRACGTDLVAWARQVEKALGSF